MMKWIGSQTTSTQKGNTQPQHFLACMQLMQPQTLNCRTLPHAFASLSEAPLTSHNHNTYHFSVQITFHPQNCGGSSPMVRSAALGMHLRARRQSQTLPPPRAECSMLLLRRHASVAARNLNVQTQQSTIIRRHAHPEFVSGVHAPLPAMDHARFGVGASGVWGFGLGLQVAVVRVCVNTHCVMQSKTSVVRDGCRTKRY